MFKSKSVNGLVVGNSPYGSSPLESESQQLGTIIQPLYPTVPVPIQSVQTRYNFFPIVNNRYANQGFVQSTYTHNSQIRTSQSLQNSGPLNQPGQVNNAVLISNDVYPKGLNQVINNGFLG